MARNITIRYNVDASDLEASRDVIRQIARELGLTEDQISDINQEFREQAGILQKLRVEEQRLITLRERANDADEIRRYNQEIARTRREIENLTGETQNLNRQTQQTSNGFKSFAKVASGAIAAIGIGSLIKDAVGLAAGMEQLEIQFKQFTGSAENAQMVLGDIEAFAASTPFQFETLAEAGRNLLAFGVEVDDLLPNLRQLGDISAGSGNDIGELAELFGKAKVQGRLFAEDINQFLGRGIPIVQGLAKEMGVTDQEVKKLVETGKVGFPELQGAINQLAGETGQYFGLTEQLADSTSGKLSTLKDNWDAILRTLGQELLPVVSDVVSELNNLLTGFEGISTAQFLVQQNEATVFLAKNIGQVTEAAKGLANEFGLSDFEFQKFLNTLNAFDVKVGDLDGTVENVREKLIKYMNSQKAAEKSTSSASAEITKQANATKKATEELGKYIVNLDILIEKQKKIPEDIFDPKSADQFQIDIPKVEADLSSVKSLYDDLFLFVQQEAPTTGAEIANLLQGLFEKIGPALAAGFEIASNLTTAFFQRQENELEAQKQKELQQYGITEEQKQAINEKFAAREDELRKKKAQQEKRLAIFETIINTAAAIVAALPNIPLSLIAAATGATQLAVIQSQQFKKGGYTGDVGRDQVAGLVHGREFVIDAETTKQLGLRGKDMRHFKKRLQPMIMNEVAMGNLQLMRDRKGSNSDVVAELKSLKKKIGGLQIHNIILDENGFTKFISSRDSFRHHISTYTHG